MELCHLLIRIKVATLRIILVFKSLNSCNGTIWTLHVSQNNDDNECPLFTFPEDFTLPLVRNLSVCNLFI
jgi:hypothetical protein